jgi:hypothetical protein
LFVFVNDPADFLRALDMIRINISSGLFSSLQGVNSPKTKTMLLVRKKESGSDSDSSSCGERHIEDETTVTETDSEGDSEFWWVMEKSSDETKKVSACVDCGRDVIGRGFQHCYRCWAVSR